MIELYTGNPGSGKSLHLAQLMEKWIHVYGLPVVGNFTFNSKMCRPRKWGSYLTIPNSDLSEEFLIDFSNQYKIARKLKTVPEEEILLVIDECQLIFNARGWNQKGRNQWISFFTQHRKLGYRCVLVTQASFMIDKQIRELCEYEYNHKKVKNAGKLGAVMNVCAGGGLHQCTKYYMPMGREKVDSEFFKYRQKYSAMYNSYNIFDSRL